jgi:anti-sigma28 factor (negative regulator of flagellin synthesis)
MLAGGAGMPTDGLKWGDLPDTPSRISLPTAGRACVAGRVEEERGRRVEAVRRAVEAGTYRVDSLQIADALLERHALDVEEL